MDYGKKTMYCTISSINGSTTSEEVALEDVPTKFILQSNYNNNDRRAWFDNLKIQRIAAGEYVPEGPALADFEDGKYYLVNVSSKKAWGAGNSWGTQGSLVKHPEYVTLHKQEDGTYFMETLSFGVDAAIALDTTKRRNSGSHTTGGNLYLSSGIRLFGQHTDGYTCHVSYDGGPTEDLHTIILAVQLGPTYGGGFKICPHASPADELLDVCFNTYIPSVPKTLGLFLFAGALIRADNAHRQSVGFPAAGNNASKQHKCHTK
jgi:hypothetical protein